MGLNSLGLKLFARILIGMCTGTWWGGACWAACGYFG